MRGIRALPGREGTDPTIGCPFTRKPTTCFGPERRWRDDEEKIEGDDEPSNADRPTTNEAPSPALADDPTGDNAPPHVPPPPSSHEVARRPKNLNALRHPTQAKLDEHVLTHLPFAAWCECCVAGQRPNALHRRTTGPSRTLPLITADYCFLKGPRDSEALTALVLKVKPKGLACAMAIDHKGAQPAVIDRVSRFLKNSGLVNCKYKPAQERPRVYMLEPDCQRAGRTLKREDALSITPPEQSYVEESASNGYAEKRNSSL